MLNGIPPDQRSRSAGVVGRSRGFGRTAQSSPATSVATSISITPATVSFALGKTQQFTATVLDQFGANMGLSVTWSSNSGNVTINSSTGLATGAAYGSATITATYQTLTNTASATVQQPTQLAMITQPGSAVTGSAFGTQPVIELRDGSGNPDAESGRTVTVSIQSGSGTLSGTTSVTVDSNGRAVFTNLAITATAPPSSFTLAFACTGLTGVNSSSFSVTASSLPALSLYYNSTEPGGNGSNPDVLLADDFTTGAPAGSYFGVTWGGGPSWYVEDGDHSGYTATQKGWFGTIFANPITPAGAIVADVGAFTNWAATTGVGTGDVQGNMADHNLARDVSEFYYRVYVKFSSGYQFSGMKFMTLNLRNQGGIHFGDFHFNVGAGALSTTGQLMFQPIGSSPESNSNLNFNCFGNEHWYCLIFHCKQGTGNFTADGVLECWADDMGTDGQSGPASPTLRYSNTSYRWPKASGSDLFGNLWHENWGNTGGNPNQGSLGEMRRKNIMVRETTNPGFRTS